jgi:outer membrane protein OmpA-like peptidoglycan-associated protein
MESSDTSENPIIFQENLRLIEQLESFIVPDASSLLATFGCGPVVPVASNKTDDNKAKNRRVELAAQ